MSRAWALLVLSLAFGCAATPRAELPYSVETVPTAEQPAHPETLALVVLADARPAEEAVPNGEHAYRGRPYDGTVVDRLGDDPMWELTVAIANHLAKARVFSKVMVVRRREDAPEAHLFLEGELVRLRGYVESEPEDPDAAEPELKVLADVELGPLLLMRDEVLQARFRVGWSFHDTRPAQPVPPDPWAIAAEALRPTLDQLVVGLSETPVKGALEPVKLAAASSTPSLEEIAPPDWALERGEGTPIGWTATASCATATWVARRERGYHRRLGPYRPTVQAWRCPETVGLSWDRREDFPADYLGKDASGARWLALQVGSASWRRAPEQLGAALGLASPAGGHWVKLGPGPEDEGLSGSVRSAGRGLR